MNRREFLIFTAALFLNKPSLNDLDISIRSENSLEKYLRSIDKEYLVNKEVVEKIDVMAGFKDMSMSKRLEDFSMYFPIYKAGEIKYQAPWFLLWLTHEQETAASIALFPENNGYKGGMQRDSYFYNDTYINEAAEGWGILSRLPQRYSQDKGCATNDWQEILFAARKMSEDAGKLRSTNNDLGLTFSYLEAQFLYCNRYSAKQRIQQFKKIDPLFTMALRDFKQMEFLRRRNNIE